MTFTTRFTPVPLKDTAVFTPLRTGTMDLQHRVVMAPLTRRRNINNVPTELMAEYYSQRSSRPGTLIILEATYIAEEDSSLVTAPGIWSEEQVEAWKKINDAIHANGSYSFHQLWALGRQGDPKYLAEKGYKLVAPSAVYADEETEKEAREAGNPIHELTKEEIKGYAQKYIRAAENALRAGADGVELHSANGYLPNQFLDPSSNLRTDEYGGSIENRARFVLEIIDALVEAIGAEKVGVRFSPLGRFSGMSGSSDFNWMAQYCYLLGELERRAQQGNRLAYVHVMEPRTTNHRLPEGEMMEDASNDYIYNAWKGVVVRCGDYALNPQLATEHAKMGHGKTLLAYGRWYIANRDLPDRLYHGYPLDEYDRSTFYTPGPVGLTDLPTYDEAVTLSR